ncbi:Alpha/Beta hydrolase protein [Cercophora newfieldiana]|uniref:Alpha/Beta hydrolase protein n=1 Tax=Cercophora newfieldiana TaxID=92897 RepID=A0AA39YJ22_9PEZI|nr:Alpha/Beta hydrolase protein [Cercophora newfieldiana]
MASIIAAIIVAALTIKKSKASPTNDPRPCVQLEVPVSIDTTAIKWLQPKVDNNIEAVDWVRFQTTRTSPNTTESAIGQITIKKTFKINGQLCVPPKGSKSSILQIATHGGGFDKRYWDAEIKPKEYSYVQAALAEGYSIFTYDRLGTGLSSKPDAYTDMQLNIHVEILRALTALARSGKLISASKRLSGSKDAQLTAYQPSKIVHVGHSIGSITSVGLITHYPAESDGLIATGFLHTNIPIPGLNVGSWGFEFARQSNPVLFKDHGSGYLVSGTKYNIQLNFLRAGSFEPEVLDYAFKIRQPIAVSEFKSILTAFGPDFGKFEGPVQLVIGENDYGVCGGDCNGTYSLDEIKQIYASAKDVAVHVQPGTGHGLTLSTNATAGYKVSFEFLRKNGL